MKLKFMGFRQQNKAGCSVCGKRKKSDYTFKREKKMVLPSGRTFTFYAGQEYEVNETDGEFLLAQTYLLNGKTTSMFEKVW